jgi:hypothetical protein
LEWQRGGVVKRDFTAASSSAIHIGGPNNFAGDHADDNSLRACELRTARGRDLHPAGKGEKNENKWPPASILLPRSQRVEATLSAPHKNHVFS